MTPGRQPDKIKVSPQGILGFAVHVTPVIDVDDVDTPQVVIDAVDDPVAPAAGRAQAGKQATQLAAEPVGPFSQGAEDERHTGRTDLIGQAEKVTFGAGGDPYLVRRIHPDPRAGDDDQEGATNVVLARDPTPI